MQRRILGGPRLKHRLTTGYVPLGAIIEASESMWLLGIIASLSLWGSRIIYETKLWVIGQRIRMVYFDMVV